jgi:hypothetical protein
MRHGPPSWTLSRAGRLNATRPRLGFRPPPNNSCPGHHLPPRLGPPYPDASALRSACRVVDHRYVLMVNFCQDMMQEGRAKPACLSNFWRIRPPAPVYCQKGPLLKFFNKKDHLPPLPSPAWRWLVPCRHSSIRHGATSPCRLARSRHPAKFCTKFSHVRLRVWMVLRSIMHALD